MSEKIQEIKDRRAGITDYAVNAGQQPLFGRVTRCVVENFPVFAAPNSAPIAYVADMEDAKFYVRVIQFTWKRIRNEPFLTMISLTNSIAKGG